jgi:hypothetical protein
MAGRKGPGQAEDGEEVDLVKRRKLSSEYTSIGIASILSACTYIVMDDQGRYSPDYCYVISREGLFDCLSTGVEAGG